MKTQFSDTQLSQILDQSLIYQCACPAQVAKHIIGLRDLFAYQQSCLNQTDTDAAVHKCIAADAQRAHAILETCLHEVLVLEQWDMHTLKMPVSLQKTPRTI